MTHDFEVDKFVVVVVAKNFISASNKVLQYIETQIFVAFNIGLCWGFAEKM